MEGVNTTAKNVIIYDEFKGDAELTAFDVKNIKGRAGRFLVHFIGNVYSLVPLNSEEDKDEIHFSYFDEEELDAEDTVQIDKDDLKDDNLNTRIRIEKILDENKIPIEVIRSNKFIPIFKQISLINHLRDSAVLLDEIYFKGNLPSSEQLDQILNLCNDFLFNDQDKNNRNYTTNQLNFFVKFYVYKQPKLKDIISKHGSNNIDTRIRNAFNLVSHYFEFAIPKYLTAFENIFNFVYTESGKKGKGINLSFLITVLEFGHSQDHEIALKEAGLPNEIIDKISKSFSDCGSLEDVRNKVAITPSLINNLSDFEKRIFNRYI